MIPMGVRIGMALAFAAVSLWILSMWGVVPEATGSYQMLMLIAMFNIQMSSLGDFSE